MYLLGVIAAERAARISCAAPKEHHRRHASAAVVRKIRRGIKAVGVLSSAALLAVAAAFVPCAHSQSLMPDQVYSSIGVSTLAPPQPVLGADNRIHLAYELVAANISALFITLDKVAALDSHGHVLEALSGPALHRMVATYGGQNTTLAPGGSAIVFMDTSFPADALVPPTIAASLTITRQLSSAGKPAPYPPNGPLPATVSFVGPATLVDRHPAVLIEPPLRGPRWLAVNGCCSAITSHRGAVMSINGVLRAPERFAIDWVQLQPDHRLYTGDRSKLESYEYFGTPVYAVADGTVVNLYNDAAEQVPGAPAQGLTPESIGGNMLVVDIGRGNFAFFAHLEPDSLRVKLGDHVTTGELIGLLGNTGNSDAPHLHFQIMDGPSPLAANGLPFVLTHFVGQGVLDNASFDAMFADGKPGAVKAGPLDGNHTKQLPLDNEVVAFPKQ